MILINFCSAFCGQYHHRKLKNIVYSKAILFTPIQDIIWNKLKNEYDIIYNAVQCSFKAIYILWLWLDSSKYFDE